MTALLTNIPTLETERLILRAPGMQDWEAWLAFCLDDRSRFVRADDIDEGKAWRAFCHVAGMWALRGYGSFVITAKGADTALGLTGPWHPIDWPERELGWTIWSAAAEGQGYAYEAARAARDYAFGTLGWTTAVSYIDPENTRSIALAERLGAVRDPSAKVPHPEDPCLVYRHPAPEGRA